MNDRNIPWEEKKFQEIIRYSFYKNSSNSMLSMVGVRYNDRDDYVSVSLKFIQRSKSTFLSAVEMQIKVVETSEYRSRSKECPHVYRYVCRIQVKISVFQQWCCFVKCLNFFIQYVPRNAKVIILICQCYVITAIICIVIIFTVISSDYD